MPLTPKGIIYSPALCHVSKRCPDLPQMPQTSHIQILTIISPLTRAASPVVPDLGSYPTSSTSWAKCVGGTLALCYLGLRVCLRVLPDVPLRAFWNVPDQLVCFSSPTWVITLTSLLAHFLLVLLWTVHPQQPGLLLSVHGSRVYICMYIFHNLPGNYGYVKKIFILFYFNFFCLFRAAP